jgi:integrase/recombinase XerC
VGVGSLAQTYVTSRKQSGELASSSAIHNRMVLQQFATWIGREQPINAVQRGDVEQWLDALDVSPRTKRIYLSCVRTFLTWCVAQEHLTRSPADGVAGPAALPPVPRALPAVDITAVLTVLHSDRDRLIVLLMAQEAMKAGEIADIQREDVDLINWLVTVNGKGSRQRTLPISEETRDVLCRYLIEHPGPSGALLRSQNHPGSGISADYVSKLVAQWMRAAGVKFAAFDGRSGHALRQSAAAHMLANGADIREVREYLGHASLQSTEAYLRRLRAAGPLRKAAGGRSYMPSTLGKVGVMRDEIELSA